MSSFNIGDIVVRKSYGGDTHFKIVNIKNKERSAPVYILKGLLYRLEADSDGSDLIIQNPQDVYRSIRQNIYHARRHASRSRNVFRSFLLSRFRGKPGSILHIDSSQEFMETCIQHYSDAQIRAIGKCVSEDQQPYYVKRLLEQYSPDILVLTGHDGVKKDSLVQDSLDNYRTSKYFVQSVKEARKYQPSLDKLCVFAGACQSYFEAIMDVGANFASSPGRVLINALDPAFVSEKVALTDRRLFVTPQELSRITFSGSKGIGGINTRGHYA